MIVLILNAFINGLIGFIGVIMTVTTSGHELHSGIYIGAALTGLITALKDIHSLLQEPPK